MERHRGMVIVGVDDAAIRARVVDALKAEGRAFVLRRSQDLRTEDPRNHLVILETSDDVAALSQIVYGLYMSRPEGDPPEIIGLLSSEAIARNPQVAMWDIRGRAALLCLARSDDLHLERGIRNLIRPTGGLAGLP